VSERSSDETMYNHDGEEFLLVMKGTAEVLLDDERIKLEPGDAVYFDSSMKHRLLSYDGNEVQVLAIVTR
jgi:mannose-6-phosphate isomerase-like protein (cupin superfamily)